MKKITFISSALFVTLSIAAQDILVKIDAEIVAPSDGMAFPSVASANNQMVHLCSTNEGLSYEAHSGSNRLVSSSTLPGKDSEKLLRGQYLSSGASFWYLGAVNTEGYKDLNISAWHSGVLSSGGSEPQKNWIFEYCVGDVADLYFEGLDFEWKHIQNYSLELGKWTETAFTLPEECNNQKAVSFRWISNKDGIGVNGGASNTNAWTWIDEIEVSGKPINGNNIDIVSPNDINLNVSGNNITVNNFYGKATIFDMSGRVNKEFDVQENASIIYENKGIHMIKLENSSQNVIKKINIQ